MILIITRHGQTEENKLGILQGHLPWKLSELWIEQAKKLALRLKDEEIDYIYSSDLTRSADTAKEIARYHTNAPIKFTKELRERFLWERQWKTKVELWFAKDTSLAELSSNNWETPEELFNRAKKLLDLTIEKHINDTILFVCHGGLNKFIIAAILWKDLSEIKTIETLHNTSICTFEINKNRNYKMIEFNNIDHLYLNTN